MITQTTALSRYIKVYVFGNEFLETFLHVEIFLFELIYSENLKILVIKNFLMNQFYFIFIFFSHNREKKNTNFILLKLYSSLHSTINLTKKPTTPWLLNFSSRSFHQFSKKNMIRFCSNFFSNRLYPKGNRRTINSPRPSPRDRGRTKNYHRKMRFIFTYLILGIRGKGVVKRLANYEA